MLVVVSTADRNTPDGVVPPNNGQTASKIGSCLVKGVVVGAAGALIVGGVAIGAAALGVPAAVVTGGLLLTGAVGGYFTGKSVINNVQSGNYAGLAYDVGSVGGGFLAGSGIGGRVGDAINPPATRGWSFGRDIQNRFDRSKGSVGNWLATGPDAGAAAGATGFSGSGTARFLRPLTGGC